MNMNIPNPDEAYRPEIEAQNLANAVVVCIDKGMLPDEIQEVVDSTIEANAPRSND